MKNPFVYISPPPLEEKQLRRFYLMGLPNKQLERILGKNLHAKKTTLVELILDIEFG